MNKGFFWKNWETSYRIPFLLLLGLFLVNIFLYLGLYFTGIDYFFSWQRIADLEGTNFKIEDIHVGAFEIPLETPLFVIEEYFKVGDLNFSPLTYYLFGGILLFAFSLWLSILVEVKNWFYGVGMAIFAFFLASLNFEIIGLDLGLSNGFLIVSLALFFVSSYVMQSFFLKMHFWIRWAIFLGIMLGLGTWASYAAAVQYPFVFLVNFGVIVPVLLSIVFIFMNAHEVLRAFWYILVSYNERGGIQNIQHFSVISVIYLANILLLLGEYQGWWRIDIYKLDLFLLLVLSALLGLWGIQIRNEQSSISKILPFAPVGAYLFLILGLICFSTLSFFIATANDSMLSMFRTVILYSHFTMNLAFFMYVLANFIPLAREFTSLDTIIYKGKIITVSMMYYFGIGVSMSLFVGAKNLPWFLAQGGYYIGLGDSYLVEKDYQMASINYKVAHDRNDFIGHRINYMLASITEQTDESAFKLEYLRDALLRNPSPYVYVQLSNALKEEGRMLDAMFVLRDALKRFPHNLQINNNLALLYEKNQVTDSAFYYLEQAEWYGGGQNIAQNNLWMMLAKIPTKGEKLENLPAIKNLKTNVIGWANKTALFTNYGQGITLEGFQTDSTQIKTANDATFAFTYNYALNQAKKPGSKALSLLNAFMAQDTARIYGYNPHFARAVNLYYSGQVQDGIRALTSLPTLPEDSYLNVVAGLWLLEQQAYGPAVSYLSTAKNLGNTEAVFYQAIALSEMRDFAQAIPLWIEISQSKGKHAQEANQILNVLKDEAELNNDLDKFNFIHYQSRLTSLENLFTVYVSIQKPEYKARAAATLMLEYIQSQKADKAEEIFKNLGTQASISAYAQSLLHFAYCKMRLAQQQHAQLLAEIDKLKFVRIHQNYKPYFKALALAKTGSPQDLEANYLKARRATPFDEEIILALADYYFNAQRNTEKAYLTVVDGVRTNPFSVDLQKNYALLALEMGLDFYAEEALIEIQSLSTAEDIEAFKIIYNERKKTLADRKQAILNGEQP